MKQERIDILKRILADSGASAWEITDVLEEGWEFYLIGTKLDQHRVRDVNHVRLKVFRPGEAEETVGTASGEIAPAADEHEMAAAVRNLLEDARYAVNPAWRLNTPSAQPDAETADCPSVDAVAADFLHAIRTLPAEKDADINSSEIFVTRVTKRILNSEGLDVVDTYPVSMAEVVVNARDVSHEIELYRMMNSGACDTAALQAELRRAMRFGRDKLAAAPTPALGTCDLVLSTDAAVEVYRWYEDHLNAAYKFQRYSDWELGVPIADNATGDRVTLTARRTLQNSSRNIRFDEEGAWTRDLVLLSENVPRAFFGARQFAQYLGLENTFSAMNFEVSGGTASADELRQGDFLEAVEFSDFQVDSVSGDIAGEIRLGYLHQGGRILPVSGGSVSGCMSDFVPAMRFSREQAQYNSRLIPAVTRLKNVTITGA